MCLGDQAVLCGSIHTKPFDIKTISESLFRDHLVIKAGPGICRYWRLCRVSAIYTLYGCAAQSKHRDTHRGIVDVNVAHWHGLLHDNDDANAWKAINWKGECKSRESYECPHRRWFWMFFWDLTESTKWSTDFNVNIRSDVNIPVLDESTTSISQVDTFKSRKDCGPGGVCWVFWKFHQAAGPLPSQQSLI